MANILIKKVKYEGTKYYFESPELKEGLNILEGANGSGKSTFMNLIYFGLGGTVLEFRKGTNEAHNEITNDTENFVELDTTINGNPYLLQRYINRTDITIILPNGEVKMLPVNRSKNEKYIFSDWLLETLDITVVEVFQGVNHFKIGFKDLMRLIYHDQEPNPRKIYKSVDFDNIISDSELVRKIIFQLLLGKSFSDYYSTLAKQKEAEKTVSVKKSMLDEYILISKSLKENGDDLNLNFLTAEMIEKEDQHKKLIEYRSSLKIDRPSSDTSFIEVQNLKTEIINNELSIQSLQRKENESLEELSKLYQLRENLILEVTQIKKIIHSHDKLSLFSADTCPYCLRGVDRVEGHCVCGKEIDENQYERFFYNSDEYLQIFKAKQKTVETIDIAIKASVEEADEIKNKKKTINVANDNLKNSIKALLQNVDSGIDSVQLNKVDDQILSTREKINSLKQRIEIEKKLEVLQSNYDTAVRKLEELKDSAKVFEATANSDIRTKVDQFNIIYNNLMTSTLKNCRTAKIDVDDYMPVINNGEYREASSTVPIRLMYYLTLIKMSVENADVKFPKFLLIDTPETAGIDEDNLLVGLSQISKIQGGNEKKQYQIILSTALNKYPLTNKTDVFLTLNEENRLLNRKQEKN